MRGNFPNFLFVILLVPAVISAVPSPEQCGAIIRLLAGKLPGPARFRNREPISDPVAKRYLAGDSLAEAELNARFEEAVWPEIAKLGEGLPAVAASEISQLLAETPMT